MVKLHHKVLPGQMWVDASRLFFPQKWESSDEDSFLIVEVLEGSTRYEIWLDPEDPKDVKLHMGAAKRIL